MANSATRSARAVLVDAVECGSIALSQPGDAPKLRVVLHVLGTKVGVVNPKVENSKGLHFPGSGTPDASGQVAVFSVVVRMFGGIGDRHPPAVVRPDLNL